MPPEIPFRTRLAMVTGALVAFVVCVALFSGLDRRDTKAGAALIVATVASGLLLHSLVRHQFMVGEKVVLRRFAVFCGVVVAGVALVVYWSKAPAAADGFGFWGAVLVLIGVGLIIAELRRSKWASARFGPLLAVASAALLLAAYARAASGESSGVLPLLALGLVLLPTSLNLLSAVCNRALKRWPLGRAALLLLATSTAFVVTIVWAGAATNIGWQYLVPAALVVLVWMVATASRSNGDVVIVVIGVMVFLTATPTPVQGPERPTGQEQVMVVLGDSFISGEGADHYFVDTNVKGRNTCRRAPTAYAHRLVSEAPELPLDLVFLACSGAKAGEVHRPDGAARTDSTDEKGLNQIALALGRMDEDGLGADDVSFVLLSIGGNDSLFGDIAQACLGPGDCSVLGSAWRANLHASLPPLLRDVYQAAQTDFPGAPVLIVPYPVPISAEKRGCGYTTFTDREHRFLHDFTLELNAVIASVVAEPGFERLHVVTTMQSALTDAGLALCDDRDVDHVGVNFLAANGVGGLIESSVNPTNWIHNSMHPNPRGHAAMRAAVGQWLDDHPDVRSGRAGAVRTAPPAVPDAGQFGPIDEGAPCVEDLRSAPAGPAAIEALRTCTSEWSLRETTEFARFPGVLLLLPMVAAWGVGLAVVRIARIAGASLWTSPRAGALRSRLGL